MSLLLGRKKMELLPSGFAKACRQGGHGGKSVFGKGPKIRDLCGEHAMRTRYLGYRQRAAQRFWCPVRRVARLSLLMIAVMLAMPSVCHAATLKAAENLKAFGLQADGKTFPRARILGAKELESAYRKGLEEMEKIAAHKTRSRWRQPWEELRDDFLSIAATRRTGAQAAQSLYRAAECQDALARASHVSSDAKLALALYETVARAFPSSARADDALLAAGILAGEQLKSPRLARNYLETVVKKFPQGDSAPQAKSMLALVKSGKSIKSETAQSSQKKHPFVDLSKSPVKTVVIDAGHGGADPGTLHNGIIERKVTLDVALRLGKILQDNGIRVVYTRSGNSTVKLERRAEIANAKKADLFVSVHVNANNNHAINGLEVYYHDGQIPARTMVKGKKKVKVEAKRVALTARMRDSRQLALDVSRQMKRTTKNEGYSINNKGVKTASYHVISATNMPAVLAEIGYCTNDRDAKLLHSKGYRQAVAQGIANGILAWRDRAMGLLTADSGTSTLQ